MPALRPDNALNEYLFSPEESRAARFLDPLKIQWLQTKYAQTFKEKASKLLPESVELDRSYICSIAELDGQLNLIQELLAEHKTAIDEINAIKNQTGETVVVNIDSISERASKLVDG